MGKVYFHYMASNELVGTANILSFALIPGATAKE